MELYGGWKTLTIFTVLLQVNNEWYDIIDWTKSNRINKYNSTNVLSIRKWGNKIKFYINDYYVNEALFDNFLGDKIGFNLNRNMKVEIDNLIVKQFGVEQHVGVEQQTTNNAEKRFALIIGNSAYSEAPLRNPVNDAEDLSKVLHALGFRVTTKINSNQRQMKNAINDFMTILTMEMWLSSTFQGMERKSKAKIICFLLGRIFSRKVIFAINLSMQVMHLGRWKSLVVEPISLF